MLGFLGEKPAEAKIHAGTDFALEIAMSKPRFDRVERRDRRKSYNNDPPIYKIDAFYRVEYILY
jgi:hypothetical protein